jgi:hypothetical protein
MPIPGKTIDFVIIGAAKAGTTSLASWLGMHPDVCVSNPKETMFFGSPKLFDQGLEYFHSLFFDHYRGESLIGESTPAYSNRDRHPGTPKRLSSVNPDAKIIYIVRHPIKKAESTWQMHSNLTPDLVKSKYEELCRVKAREGFESYLSEPCIFKNLKLTCCYEYQLQPWKDHYGKDRIHVMFLEDLAANRAEELVRLCEFLGIDPRPLLANPLSVQNSLSKRRVARPFVKTLVQSRLQRLFPAFIRRSLSRNLFFSLPQSSFLHPTWSDHLFLSFAAAVQPDVQQFLLHHGKRKDYYSFHRAES